jgi:outer membrane protein
MKKLFKVALVAAGMLFASNFANAQSKIGYINFEGVVQDMPEFKTVKAQLDLYQKQFFDQLSTMQNELQNKGKEYQAAQDKMTDAVRTTKQAELQDIQKRIQDLNTSAQQQVENKANELYKPLTDKATAAINAVAKEKGISYVFNSAQTQLLVSPPGDDLMPAVKLKLGLK